MKRLIHSLTLLLFSSLITANSSAQSKFADGFKEGYKKGYCYEKQNCVAPPAPPVPALNVGEKSDSYQDGYNRGFKMGSDAQNGSTGNGQKGYKTASADPIDYAYKSNESKVQENVAKNRNAIFDKIMTQAQEKYDKADYTGCIKACNDAMQITNLVSQQSYNLLAKSYEALGKKGKAKKYYKKAARM